MSGEGHVELYAEAVDVVPVCVALRYQQQQQQILEKHRELARQRAQSSSAQVGSHVTSAARHVF